MNKITCKRCGCTGVRWEKTADGRWYLAVDAGLQDSREARAYAAAARKRPHLCANHPGNCGQKCADDRYFARQSFREMEEVREDLRNADEYRAYRLEIERRAMVPARPPKGAALSTLRAYDKARSDAYVARKILETPISPDPREYLTEDEFRAWDR